MSSDVHEYNVTWPNGFIIQSPEDIQKQVILLKECEIDKRELDLLREKDDIKDQRIANLEKELDLAKQEIGLKDKIIEIKDMEIHATRRALADMKEVSDRAIQLVETTKPKSNWQLYGLLGVIAFVAGLAVGL